MPETRAAKVTAFRRWVRQNVCPTCKAPAGHLCTGPYGQARASNHQARVDLVTGADSTHWRRRRTRA